jgi:diguanylate cyclase (GGDEF)-like protein/PAS domain S-box-containing protein
MDTGGRMPLHDATAPFDRAAVEASMEGVYYVDPNRQIVHWNGGAERISGHLAGDVVGKRCYDNILKHVDQDGNELCFGGCPMAATIVDGQPREAKVFLHHRDGHRIPVKVRAVAVRDERGAIVGAVETFTDAGIIARTEARLQELERLAMVDSLTGIGNRRSLEIALDARAEELKRYGWPYGVLVLDLDKFKRINDRHGHETGDQVLKMVAATFAHTSRASDTVGRWGGDEFLAVLSNANEAGLRAASERIRAMIERSVLRTSTGPLSITVSIGGALAAPGMAVDDLVRLADRRVYTAKATGRNRVSLAA